MKNKVLTPEEISARYYTMDKTMKVLKTDNERTILNLIEKGKLLGMKVGREHWILVDSLTDYLCECQKNAFITN